MPNIEQLNLEASKTGGRKYDSAYHVPARTVPTAKAKVTQGGSGHSSNHNA